MSSFIESAPIDELYIGLARLFERNGNERQYADKKCVCGLIAIRNSHQCAECKHESRKARQRAYKQARRDGTHVKRVAIPKPKPHCGECGIKLLNHSSKFCFRHTPQRFRRNEVCARGHARTPENTHTRPNGDRYCRICHNDRQRARWRSTAA